MPTLTEAVLSARSPFVATRMAWSAIFAGVAIALAIELMFALLGAGIGLSLIDPAGGDSPSAGGFGIGGLIWWGLGTIIALGAGGHAPQKARTTPGLDLCSRGCAAVYWKPRADALNHATVAPPELRRQSEQWQTVRWKGSPSLR